MAKVTDIQDKNGATREIQDKDLANRTSQSSIASSDYVLLEDTNGAYHKIAKASFTEAVRGALGSVINSVAKGTDIAKVPVLDSNNDLGMGTLSNLASVLGVPNGTSFANWDASHAVDTGILIENAKAYLMFFRAATSNGDSDYYSVIVPISTSNLSYNFEIVQGDYIWIRKSYEATFSFSISANKTLVISGTYGVVSLRLIGI